MNNKSVKNILKWGVALDIFGIIGTIWWFSETPFNEFARNSESRDYAGFVYSLLMLLLIMLIIVLPIFIYCITAINKHINSPIISKAGKVLDKQKNGNFYEYTLEFEDSTRKTLIAENSVILAIGDVGNFNIQGNIIVDFRSQTFKGDDIE